MAAFDDAWAAEQDAAFSVMGSTVVIGGVSVIGIVDPIEASDRNQHGGKTKEVSYNVHISNASYVAAAVAKGMSVVADNVTTRVISLVSLGQAGWRLECGDENPRSNSLF